MATKRKATFKRPRRARKKRRTADKIKTVSDVRRAVQSTAPSRAKMDSISVSITSTVQTLLSVSEIAFNDDPSEFETRQSPKITLGSFRFKGTLVVGDATNLVRLLFVRSKNQTNAAFAPTSCFYSNPGGTVPPAVVAQINTRNVDVLWDHTYNLQDTSESNPAVRPANFFIDRTISIRKTLKYNQVASGTVPELPRNMTEYYFVAVSDSGVLPNPSVRFEAITWFKNID